ncbi:hypothetical protein F4804DRAFT_296634 [Jackrogersella minutella]|nr:hypothetical protein F4804DRAFT_296634 [Jackrogersella minutella]
MNVSSRQSTPPSSPPRLPPISQIYDSNTTAPNPTSELSDLSDLSDLPNTTPTVSASEEEDGPSEDNYEIDSEHNRLRRKRVVDATLDFWKRNRSLKFGFEDFLQGWLEEEGLNNREAGWRKRHLRNVLKKTSVQERLNATGIKVLFDESNSQDREIVDIAAFRRELLTLLPEPAFSEFDPGAFIDCGEEPCAVEDVCNTQWIENTFEQAWSRIEAVSPHLATFFSGVLVNERSHLASYSGRKALDIRRAVLITAMLLNSIASQRSTFLSQSIGFYLHSSGVQRQVIDTLARFGVCSSYLKVLQKTQGITDRAQVRHMAPV